MSNIHPFSQAGFWDFVANLKARNSVEAPAPEAPAAPGNRAMGRPRGGRMGRGRRARNDQALPLAEMDPVPSTIFDAENEKALPPQYQPLPHQAEVVAANSENEKTAADAMPPQGGRKRGPGPRGRRQAQGLGGEGPRGRRMRMALFEDGSFPSEEELAAMAEVRRLRRLRRQANNGNGNGNGEPNADGQGPRARRMRRRFMEQTVTAETGNNGEGEINRKRGMGPRAHRRRNNAEALGPRQMELRSGTLVDVSSDDDKTTGGPRGCGPRGGRGPGGAGPRFKKARAAQDMVRGGLAKYAPIVEEGANPSHGQENQTCGKSFGPRARRMAAFRQQANLNGESCTKCGHGENNGVERELPMRPRMGRHGMHHAMRQQKWNQAHVAPVPEDQESGMAPPLRQRQFNKHKQAGRKNANCKGNKFGKLKKKGFNPGADIFATPGSYIVHLPVPGATQQDIGIMWDAEKNVLRIAGMVERPAPDQIAEGASLVRAKRAVGPFRRWVRFGKRHEQVKVYENGITAKLEDGILKVEVPKYDGDDAMTSDGEYVEVKQDY